MVEINYIFWQSPITSERSPLVFGAASLSTIYNPLEHLASDVPLRTVRLALR
jgi:hypothetical protein